VEQSITHEKSKLKNLPQTFNLTSGYTFLLIWIHYAVLRVLRLCMCLFEYFAFAPKFTRAVLLTLLACAHMPSGYAEMPDKVQFNRDIRPIFSDKCFSCHGLDAKHRKAELRLDTPEGAYALNEDKFQAIKPGDLKNSEAWRLINSTDEEEIMPPLKSHKKLSAEEKELIKRWIEQGASYQKHWAFEPQVKTEPPAVTNTASARNEIDRFVLARLEREGLGFSSEAPRETLIRRASFALTGLPPSIKEADEFLTDVSPEAYEKMVDRYLGSARFGEEMARHWLDLARYGDTHGLHLDNERQMWAYRDWVIKAFNVNKPFDQFTVEQIAGDQIPNATREQQVATGFNRCNVSTSEGGAIDDEFIFRYAVDRASTMSEVWMGMTVGCAVCHDHKFDPISAKEFYSIYAFFHSNSDPAMDGNVKLTKPIIKLPDQEQDRQLLEFEARMAATQKKMNQILPKVNYMDPSTIDPKPAPKEVDEVWIEDEFPTGAVMMTHPGNHPLKWITAEEGPVFSGKRAIKRTDAALAQDFYQEGGGSFELPVAAKAYFHVYIDPNDPPEAVMIQLRENNSWEHRMMWGESNLIPFGSPNTHERFIAGPIPEAGKWVQLEVDVEKINLKAGMKITGVAFTLYGGTAYFDKMGVKGVFDESSDPMYSFNIWQKNFINKDAPNVPHEIRNLLKEGPKTERTLEEYIILRNYFLQKVCLSVEKDFSSERKEFFAARKGYDDLDTNVPGTFIFRDRDIPRESYVMERGQYDKKGEKVMPGTPAIFPPLKSAKPDYSTRLDLAQWLVSPEHPLTARVAANRFWQQIFGTGLVKTSSDFGSQGEPPTHPELLDWLAIRFRETGWNTKALIKHMAMSSTFRQASNVTPDLLKKDPANRLFARGPRFRLDAEQIRDNALFVSGLMSSETGGRGAMIYQPPNIWEPVGFQDSDTRNYKQDSGEKLYRRSIYAFLKRTAPPPFMGNFDAPNREQSCALRERSNTPLQALQLMNDVQHYEAARGLAERMIAEGGATPEERIDFAYRATLARKPGPEETAVVKATLTKHLEKYLANPEQAKSAIRIGAKPPKEGVPEPELAAYTLTANLILNLDEVVNRN